MYTFPAINGIQLTAKSEDAYRFIAGLYEAGIFNFANLLPWLSANTAESRLWIIARPVSAFAPAQLAAQRIEEAIAA
jgi:hypothetical protein